MLDIQHPRRAIELAPFVERLGYSRYWLGEHHGSATQNGSPEILTGIIAGITRSIRVGPAGILLRYYSAYKVAQGYRLLEHLYGPRIDLGIARGLGGNAEVTAALLDTRADTANAFDDKVHALALLLRNNSEHAQQLTKFGATSPSPDVWVLGVSRRAALLAASIGASFGFSDYLARAADASVNGLAIIRAYRDAFQPSAALGTPRWNVAIAGAAVPRTNEDVAVNAVAGLAPQVGSCEQWRDWLREYSERYECEELVVLDLCERLDDRRRSLELFAEASELVVMA